jgi:hypothetical protein
MRSLHKSADDTQHDTDCDCGDYCLALWERRGGIRKGRGYGGRMEVRAVTDDGRRWLRLYSLSLSLSFFGAAKWCWANWQRKETKRSIARHRLFTQLGLAYGKHEKWTRNWARKVLMMMMKRRKRKRREEDWTEDRFGVWYLKLPSYREIDLTSEVAKTSASQVKERQLGLHKYCHRDCYRQSGSTRYRNICRQWIMSNFKILKFWDFCVRIEDPCLFR